MKASQWIAAACLAVACVAAPLTARADDSNETDESRGPEFKGPEGGGPDGRARPRPPMRAMKMGGDMDPAMREKFKAVHELERRVREATRKMIRGSDAEKVAAKDEARKLLGDLLDAKLAMQEAMVVKMEKRLVETKESIAKKKANREKMIEARLARMSDDADWD